MTLEKMSESDADKASSDYEAQQLPNKIRTNRDGNLSLGAKIKLQITKD